MAKLLSSLPIGTLVKFGKHVVNAEDPQSLVWMVADKNHSGYPNGSVTLIAQKIVDIRAFDAEESKLTSGNNNYGLSNINQWLNSDATAGAWYSATHSNDAPPNADNIYNGDQYYTRAGFLFNFDIKERTALMPTTIKVQSGTTADTTITAKVFLPSLRELGLTSIVEDSTVLEYFKTKTFRCTVTDQVQRYGRASKPTVGSNWSYWTRNHSEDTTQSVCRITASSGDYDDRQARDGSVGIRPVINLSGDLGTSTTTDSDGCYTLSVTNAPSAITNLTLTTSTVYNLKPCSIKWNASTDPNGDAFTYKVHLYYDDVEQGNATDVGIATSYTLPSVKDGVSTIKFGVEAVDSLGHSSGVAYVSAVVITNYAPTISGSNADLGKKTVGFSQTYSVSDADKNTVTVTEYIDNEKIRSYVVTLGATNTFAVTDKTWLKLANGIHTLKITATDGIEEATRVYTFTKSVTTLVAQRTTPLASSTKPTRLVATVVKNIPSEAIFTVEACNNGFDATPVWEDITSTMLKGQAHVFTNTVKTASQWGVNIRVTVNRNGGEGACYITEIGGNFE